jgi:hypothetical protein
MVAKSRNRSVSDRLRALVDFSAPHSLTLFSGRYTTLVRRTATYSISVVINPEPDLLARPIRESAGFWSD